MSIQPLYDRVLLEPIEEQLSSTGLYIPTSQSERGLLMRVITSGSDCRLFEPGEVVLVHKFAGVEFGHAGKKFFIVKAIDVLAKLGR